MQNILSCGAARNGGAFGDSAQRGAGDRASFAIRPPLGDEEGAVSKNELAV